MVKLIGMWEFRTKCVATNPLRIQYYYHTKRLQLGKDISLTFEAFTEKVLTYIGTKRVTQYLELEMAEKSNKKAIKRIVRTITLTEEDLSKLDGIERVISAHGHRIKTDSKLIRAAISIANKSVNNKPYNIDEVAEKVISEDGRTLFRGVHGE